MDNYTTVTYIEIAEKCYENCNDVYYSFVAKCVCGSRIFNCSQGLRCIKCNRVGFVTYYSRKVVKVGYAYG